MTLGPSDAQDRPDGAPPSRDVHDPSIVPGLGDPDRFDPAAPAVPPGPLDPAKDPDRMPRAGEGRSLTDLVGKRGAQEDERDSYTWALGLLGVLGFLALVAYLFGEVLAP
jgi:hypothetical protein